jgi:hypothetical protein
MNGADARAASVGYFRQQTKHPLLELAIANNKTSATMLPTCVRKRRSALAY